MSVVGALNGDAGDEAVTLVQEINEIYAIEADTKQRGYYRYVPLDLGLR